MTTAEIVKTVANAFDKSDYKTILSHVADDVQWLILGSAPLVGKEALKQFFIDMFYCDIYELESDQVKKITSYMIDKKQ